MKLFVVLALGSFIGCQSYVLRSDEPKLQLDLVKDTFWEYFVEGSKTAIGVLKTIEESELAQQVSDKIRESVKVARHYRNVVEEQVFVISDELHKTISERVEQLSESLKPHVNELRVQLEPLTAKLEADIQQQVKKVRQVLDPYTESLDTHQLSETLDNIDRKVRRFVDSSLSELQKKLDPSTEELEEEVNEAVQQIERNFGRPLLKLSVPEVVRIVQTLQKTLGPYSVGLYEGLHLFTSGLADQLSSLWESAKSD